MDKKEFYDIRAIRMVKSTARHSLTSYADQEGKGFICLGHFDIMEIRALREENGELAESPLEVIRRDSQDCQSVILKEGHLEEIEENYTHPLYVLRQFETGRDAQKDGLELDEFWEMDTNYLIVTRFHCDRTDRSSAEDAFSKILSRRCEALNREAIVSHVTGNSETAFLRMRVRPLQGGEDRASEVAVTFYESLELGDIVGFMKSNSLSAILEVQRQLYETDEVRDAYTYCGIDQRLFDQSQESVLALLRKRGDSLKHFSLGYVSTRFSIKDVAAADKFFQEVFPDARENFFVTGTADAVINWNGCDEWTFLETMRRIVRAKSNIYTAFNDIITRVGLCYRPPAVTREDALHFKRKDFYSCMPNYQTMLDKLYQSLKNSMYPWSGSLIKLLGTLHTMYENCVMDDLSDLLMPGVQALLERILYLMGQESMGTRDHEDIWEFLEHWTSLVNDISHLESQLVQHPELTAVRYYIPAMMLLFEQKLVIAYVTIIHRVEKLIMEGTQPNVEQRTFGPILFVCSDENVNTKCFLDPEYNDEYTGKCPLGIFVPIDRLYRPWEMAHVLCHELAHYCGDALRQRDLRLDCLFESAAAFLMAELDDVFDNQNPDNAIPEEREFQERLARRIQRQYPRASGNENSYLSFIGKNLPSAVIAVAFSKENLAEYQDIILKFLQPEDQLAKIYALNHQNAMDTGSRIDRRCRGHILECLLPLYKECYADIIMILLLDCSFSDYYRCVYEDEYKSYCSALEASEHHTDRMALVGLTIRGLEKENSAWDMSCFEGSNWASAAREKIAAWEKAPKDPNVKSYQWLRMYLKKAVIDGKEVEILQKYTLLADEATQMLRYLKSCAKQVQEKLNDGKISQEVERLRKCVAASQDEGFHWNELRTFLEAETSSEPEE